MLLTVVLWLAFCLKPVLSATSPYDLGTGLHFLLQNDLNWHTTFEHNGSIVLDRVFSNDQAIQACQKLNESLLPVTGIYFESDIRLLLSYLAHQGHDPRQGFWVGSSRNICSAISLRDGIHWVPCDTRLKGLCSQSAPYRTNKETDPRSEFHIDVRSQGTVFTGTRDKLSFRFLGIPYAEPFQRFTYSKVHAGTSPISALQYGPACAQSSGGSENCLFLNVYTPYLPLNGEISQGLKPVMVWIHGGGFTGGDASNSIYDGGNLVSRGDVVVVNMNYCLGTLGFLALDDGITNGNFGIADVITALQWVQKHIASFGGDPNLVTILGNSAGAGAVRALIAAKPAFGLFKGAIAHSSLGGFGYATAYARYYTIQQQFEGYAKPLIVNVGCGNATDVLACLRELPAQTLLNAPNPPRYIVVDGEYITTDELKLDGSGPAADAHVMFGWTRDDGSDFIGAFPTDNTTALEKLTGAGLDVTVARRALYSGLFPLPVGPNPAWNLFNQTTRISTDGQFLCVNQATLSAAAKNGVFRSVYAYQFDRTFGGWEPLPGTCNPPAAPGYPRGDPKLPYFRCHDGDLPYTNGNIGQLSRPFRDWDDLVMEQLSVDIWTSFARTFNPNPSAEFLEARGYHNTSLVLRRGGRWNSVTPGNRLPLKLIDVPFRDSKWLEVPQCEVLGYPLTMYG
ncbi:cholinesterase [Coprinopsis marcescibilis]|uniref:Carboxylic ester hydrolase n=1 Tax=Coprinopsis marcescibilis TaxID=230819 RepID=A0A5C3KXP6_COPMA|nr:cholinesterase [Coprinopsis marcescibilis]